MSIPLLEPQVLNGVVEFLQTPENLVLANMLPTADYLTPSITWDILRGTRRVAKPNIPNSEAHVVDRLGRSQATASMIYYREKKAFSPTTTMWVRAVGTVGSVQRAEDAILREVNDLNTRLANAIELAAWNALTGSLTVTYDVGNSQVIDYQFKSSHKIATVSNNWSTTTIDHIRGDVLAWKRLIMRDSRVSATDAFCSEPTINYLFNALARGVSGATGGSAVISDTQKERYYDTNVLPGFLGLNWHTVEGQYEDDNGATQQFLPDDALVLANLSYERPMEIAYGPTADFGAPQGSTGKFMKTWEQEDPSGRQALLECHFLPLIYRPDQFVYVTDLTSGS
jgi:nitrogen fixation-related uncharacterized protein